MVVSLGIISLFGMPAQAEMPELPRGKGDACVAPTEVMRRDHMKFLLHKRDRTVYEGIRTPEFSLVKCVDCHVQKSHEGGFIPVDAPGQFCEVCHTYTSVRMDCFECHATKPDSGSVPGNDALSGVHRPGSLSILSYRGSSGMRTGWD